ncbi:MAG: hypothetical protein WC928_04000 [Patescibacteria group bacterium]|jgi:rubrerythrin
MEFKECSMSQSGILLNLQKGLDSEIRAYEVCKELLGVVADADDKKIIEKIMKDEAEHIKITKDLIAVTKSFYVA